MQKEQYSNKGRGPFSCIVGAAAPARLRSRNNRLRFLSLARIGIQVMCASPKHTLVYLRWYLGTCKEKFS